jgi:hypothetical protein
MSYHSVINNIPSVVNPFATLAFNQSRQHEDMEIRRMVRDEFLNVFMEVVNVAIEACKDFRTVNMYHIANSDTVHDFIWDTSYFEVLQSECSARANRIGISIVPAEGVDIMERSVFFNILRPWDVLVPVTYPFDRRPKWLPRFRRLYICDAITLHMEDMNTNGTQRIIQSDTFFSQLRHLDEIDDFLSVDGYAPLKRMKVFDSFPDLFWKIFIEIFPPYELSDESSLGLMMRPNFNEECKNIFDSNIDKGRRKFINISRITKNILDRMILGYDNIDHDVDQSSVTFPLTTDTAVLQNIIQSRSLT